MRNLFLSRMPLWTLAWSHDQNIKWKSGPMCSINWLNNFVWSISYYIAQNFQFYTSVALEVMKFSVDNQRDKLWLSFE
jgi:hypothetical protein